MTKEENEALMYASDEDIKFYHKCVEGLPTLAGLDGSGNGSDGLPLPYGTGPHSVRCLREISEIVNPKIIGEIGLNMGWSASMWLELNPKAHLTSCDISYKAETVLAAKILTDRYRDRFNYFNVNDGYKFEKGTNLFFIDGSHLLDDVVKDIETCLSYNPLYIVLDDIKEEFGDVYKAMPMFNELELVKEMGNIALYRNKYVTL